MNGNTGRSAGSPCVVALIADDPKDCQSLLAQLAAYPVTVRLFDGPAAFRGSGGDECYCGVVITLKALLGQTNTDKQFIVDLENSFPLMRIIRDTGVIDGKILKQDRFDYFINERCRKTAPRGLRRHSRNRVYLSVEISNSAEMAASAILRGTTYDVSEHGLFIMNCHAEDWERNIWLRVRRLTDTAPISAVVRWRLPWGRTAVHPPGIGVQFTGIAAAQHAQLMQIARQHRHPPHG